jgi:hypothetical protein
MNDELQRKVQMMAIIFGGLHAAAEHAVAPVLRCAASKSLALAI